MRPDLHLIRCDEEEFPESVRFLRARLLRVSDDLRRLAPLSYQNIETIRQMIARHEVENLRHMIAGIPQAQNLIDNSWYCTDLREARLEHNEVEHMLGDQEMLDYAFLLAVAETDHVGKTFLQRAGIDL